MLTPKAKASFLQLRKEPAQATEYGYETQTDGIIDMLHGLKEKFSDELAAANKKETESKNVHATTIAQLTKYVENSSKEIDAATKRQGETQGKKGQAEADLSGYQQEREDQAVAKASLLSDFFPSFQ